MATLADQPTSFWGRASSALIPSLKMVEKNLDFLMFVVPEFFHLCQKNKEPSIFQINLVAPLARGLSEDPLV